MVKAGFAFAMHRRMPHWMGSNFRLEKRGRTFGSTVTHQWTGKGGRRAFHENIKRMPFPEI